MIEVGVLAYTLSAGSLREKPSRSDAMWKRVPNIVSAVRSRCHALLGSFESKM
jgi:hypothetical protein